MPKRPFTEDDHRKAKIARNKARQERIRRAHELSDAGLTTFEIATLLGVKNRRVLDYLKIQPAE